MSIRTLSRLTGFSERAIAGWEGGAPVSEPARRRLLEIDRFRRRLAEVVAPGSIPEWLDTPNDAFQGLKPVEVIERGEIDRLWNMIFYLESGSRPERVVPPTSGGDRPGRSAGQTKPPRAWARGGPSEVMGRELPGQAFVWISRGVENAENPEPLAARTRKR